MATSLPAPSPGAETAQRRISRLARLSLHLPNLDLRPHHLLEASNPNSNLGIPREQRLSLSSSLYSNDDEWNRRISRLSMPPTWQIPEGVDSLSTVSESSGQVKEQRDVPNMKTNDTSILEKALGTSVHCLEVNRDLRTRNFCIFALVLGVAIGITSLVVGCQMVTSGAFRLPQFLLGKFMSMGTIEYPFPAHTARHYFSGHRVFAVPEYAVLVINFSLNICLTILFDCMAFIQNTSLRWALCKEGRLVYNSNPRLLTGARNFAPNWRSTNVIAALALAMGYGSVSALTFTVYIVGMSDGRFGYLEDEPVPGTRYAIDFNGWGFIGLGISLLLQGAVSSWCLIKSKIVPTWSSNPFNTALVCAILGLAEKNRVDEPSSFPVDAVISTHNLQKRMDTKLTWLASSDDGRGMILASPEAKQLPMRLEIPRTRHFTYITWGVFAMTALWVIIIAIVGSKNNHCSSEYVDKVTFRSDFFAYWQSYCQVTISYYTNPFVDRRDWLGLIIQCVVFSFITLGIHCVELLTDIARDEFAWRKATTTGADAGRGALTEGVTSWVCWLTFAFKSLTPWIFSMALDTNLKVFNNLIPLSVLSFVMLLLALFSEFLVRREPKGPQPSTYGNIAKIAGLVDEWHPRMFWGDKGMIDLRIRKAGTAGRRLADVDMSMLYANLRV